ncbi:MAG: MerR family transcriptional regulator [Solirubrobacteraceae bacterium]
MAVSPDRALRIGDVARLVGTTARTIRYYEEIGLLGEHAARQSGAHRLYSDAEVGVDDPRRLRHLLSEALGHLELQLALVRRRAEELHVLQSDLEERRRKVNARLAALPPA